ncbi:MAG: hypothetical protein H0T78_00605 [Longispora sp.]|nr:hypothetical protein [Longispora sp. (in: high G+C Gram-positive bacteria)]
MDLFSRTVLPAAAEAGIRSLVLTQHMPVFRRCVNYDDTAVLIAECHRTGSATTGVYLMLLTERRMLVTRQSRISGRIRVHLDVSLDDLSDVVWLSNDRQSAIEFATTIGDTRHRFNISGHRFRQLWHVSMEFTRLFSQMPIAV